MKKILTIVFALTMVMAMSVSASAYSYNGTELGETLKNGSYEWTIESYCEGRNVKNYFINKFGTTYQLYFVDSVPYVSNGRIYLEDSANYDVFNYDSNSNTWFYNTSAYLTEGSYLNPVSSDVIWAGGDIKYQSGSLFMAGDPNFLAPPLAEMVLNLTEEELVTVAIPEMVGAMKVLVPCGVGLTALLVGLKLFGKRSLIFRS